ncbi:MAG: hypothetical protein LBV08_10730 [Clostridiales bacterium]|nr:hypothetical protein [Clostridiales bacterium]
METSIEEVSREIILAPVDELVEVGARVA